MKILFAAFATLLASNLAWSDQLMLPNLGKNATGTTNSSHPSLDVNVTGGTLTTTEAATAANGGALPALQKVIAGYDGSNTRVVKTDAGGAVQVDVESSALPTGAANQTKQDTGNTSLASIDGKITAVNTGAVVVSSSALPSGASTAAKQPALGTAGTPSADTITIQGVASMTPVRVEAYGTAGSGSSAAATVTTVITLTKPANAIGFFLMNMDTSTTNCRWAIGRTATATLGQQLQPGRDTGFVPAQADVSLVAESGTVTYDIQWLSR